MNITASLKLSWPRKLRTIKHFLSAIIPIVSLENANHHLSRISLAAMRFSQFKKPSLHSMLFNNFCDHERIMRRWSFRGVSLVGQWSCDELKRKNAWFFRVLPPSNSLETIKVNLVYSCQWRVFNSCTRSFFWFLWVLSAPGVWNINSSSPVHQKILRSPFRIWNNSERRQTKYSYLCPALAA